MSDSMCPNCQLFALVPWNALAEDERYVVTQRPSPDDPSPEHRQNNHLWCRRCWFEHCQMGDVYTT